MREERCLSDGSLRGRLADKHRAHSLSLRKQVPPDASRRRGHTSLPHWLTSACCRVARESWRAARRSYPEKHRQNELHPHRTSPCAIAQSSSAPSGCAGTERHTGPHVRSGGTPRRPTRRSSATRNAVLLQPGLGKLVCGAAGQTAATHNHLAPRYGERNSCHRRYEPQSVGPGGPVWWCAINTVPPVCRTLYGCRSRGEYYHGRGRVTVTEANKHLA